MELLLSDLLLVAAVLIPHGIVHCCLLRPLKKMSVGIKTPLKISIADPDQLYPYGFGPPGSGSESISRRYGS